MCVDKHSCRCIDGRIVGSVKCVGYCKCDVHKGFLTRELRQQHDCIGKNCSHYKPLTSVSKPAKKAKAPSLQYLLDMANEKATKVETIRFLRAVQADDGSYDLFFVAVAGYSLDTLTKELENEIGAAIRCKRCDYKYEISEKLFCSL